MRNAFLFFTILLAAGCGHVKVTPSPLFDEGPLSAPCLLEQAANTVILRDYFPTLPSMDTLEVTATAADPWLRYMDIQTADGQKGALVLKPEIEKHADWVDEFKAGYDHIGADNIDDVIQAEIGKVFMHVLEDAGVYKRTPEGQKAFDKFVSSL